MSNIWKRSLSLLLVMVMVMGMVPMGVLATETDGEYPDGEIAEVTETGDAQIGSGEGAEEEIFVAEQEAAAVSESKEELVTKTVIDVTETTSDPVALAVVEYEAIPAGATVGMVWLDRNNEDALLTNVMQGGLRDLILKAVGRGGEKNAKVLYTDGNAAPVDVSNPTSLLLAGMAMPLYDAIRAQQVLVFQIQSGNETEDAYIVCRDLRRAKFTVSATTIESEGEPADLDAKISNALAGLEVKVTGTRTVNGVEKVDDLTKLSADYIDVVAKPASAFTWPKPGQTVTVGDAVTASIQDALGVYTKSGYGALTLKDTTTTYTVTYYMTEGGEKVAEYTGLLKDQATPKPLDPIRQYYTFKGWEGFEAKVSKNAAYVAKWQPNMDMDKNGVADQEQSYTITFDYNYPEGVAGEPEPFQASAKWGVKIASVKPADPTLEGYTFLGWSGISGTVTGSVTVKASWIQNDEEPGETEPSEPGETPPSDPVAEEYQVVYHLIEGNFFTLTTKDGLAKDVKYDEAEGDGVVWNGWHKVLTFVEGTSIPATWEKEAFKFENVLTENLQLVGEWLVDGDNDNVADAYTDHVYMFKEYGAQNNSVMYTKTIWAGSEEEGIFDPIADQKYAKDSLEDTRIFKTWEVKDSSGDDYIKQIVYYPVFENEMNQNGVADAQEQTTLEITKPASLADFGKILVNGVEVSEEATFTRDSINGSEIVVQLNANAIVTKIALDPVSGVSTMSLNQEPTVPGEKVLELTYSNNYKTVTAEMPKDADLGAGVYKLHVYLRDARAFELRDPRGELSLADKTTFTEQEVYEAVVESPDYNDAAVTVTYLARAEQKGKVSVQSLKKTVDEYESMVPGAWDKVSKFLNLVQENGEWYYPYELDEVWETLDYQPEGGLMQNPETIINNKIDELSNITIANVTNLNELIGTLGVELVKLEQTLAASNIHAFADNAKGLKEFTETVDIVYQDSAQKITLDKPVEVVLKDTRIDTTLTGKAMSFTYKAFSKADILEKLTLTGGASKSDIILSVENIADKNAGTYNVVATYPGNATYKPSKSDSFKVTIKKAPVEIRMSTLEGAMESFSFAAVEAKAYKPGTNDLLDADLIQVIAGWDVTSGGLNLSKPVISGLKGVAWIVVDETLKDMLELALKEEFGETIPETLTLAQISAKITKHKAALAARTSRDAINALENLLNRVSQYVQGEVDIKFGKPDTLNNGLYVNMAVVADPNYESAYALGGIVNSPIIALPNRGGVQLYHKNSAENFYAVANGDQEDMIVKVDGKVKPDAVVHYYGITGAAEVYNSEKLPTASGIYVAATLVYEADGSKLGSDVAILLIGMEEVTIDVERLIVPEEKGEYFKPAYTIAKKDGTLVGPTGQSADITMISAKVDVDSEVKSSEYGVDISGVNVSGTVTIDLPAWVGRKWNEFLNSSVAKNYGITANLPATVDKAKVILFLNWCIDNVDGAADKLESMIGSRKSIDQIAAKTARGFELIREQVEKLPNAAKIVLKSVGRGEYTGYTEKGVYMYLGIVTDSDYLPAANGGMLVITGDPSDLVMWNTHVPYDGEGHEPLVYNNTNRDGLTFYYNRANKKAVTLLIDDDAAKFINALETKLYERFGKTVQIDNNTITINELKTKGDNWANKAAFAIVDVLADYAKSKLPERFGDNVDNGAATLKRLAEELQPYVAKALTDLDKIGDVSITIKADNDKNLPSAVGEYQFLTFSYGMVYDSATLYIRPNYLNLAPKDAEKVYGDEDPAGYNGFETTFYSYKSRVVDNKYTVIDKVDVNDYVLEQLEEIGALDLSKVQIVREDKGTEAGEKVGEHVLSLANAKVDLAMFNGTLVQDSHTTGIFEITKRPVVVEIEDMTKYYESNDPAEVVRSFTNADNKDLIDDAVLNVTLTYLPELVGKEQAMTIQLSMTPPDDLENYEIKVVRAKTAETDPDEAPVMTIQPAEIELELNDITLTVDDRADSVLSQLSWNKNVINGTVTLTYEQEEALKDQILNVVKVQDGYVAKDGIHLKHGEYEIKAVDAEGNYLTIDCGSYIVKFVNTAYLRVSEGDYVCWNVQKEIYYDDLSEALEIHDDAEAETIQMLKDYTEKYVIIAPGTTLDLADQTVTATFVVGMKGSYLTADIKTSSNPNFGKLFVDPDHIELSEESYANGANRIMPIYNPNIDGNNNGCFVFSQFNINTNDKGAIIRGLKVDEAAKKLEFQFYGATSGFARQELLIDGADDNEISVIIRLEWENASGTGKAYQDFEFLDGHIIEVSNGGNDYRLTMVGYDALDMDISSLTVKGMFVTECGAVTAGKDFTISQSTEEGEAA